MEEFQSGCDRVFEVSWLCLHFNNAYPGSQKPGKDLEYSIENQDTAARHLLS